MDTRLTNDSAPSVGHRGIGLRHLSSLRMNRRIRLPTGLADRLKGRQRPDPLRARKQATLDPISLWVLRSARCGFAYSAPGTVS
jgi:hypothetical protein